MRSARMVVAAAAASAALALGAPGAYAVGSDHDDSSYSKEHTSKDESSKEYGKEESKEEGKDESKDESKDHGKDSSYDSPRGGVHTGGGALTAVNEDESSSKDKDSDSSKDSHSSDSYKDSESYKDSHSSDSYKDDGYDKPRGGVHTGGGALTMLNNDEWGSKDSGSSKDSHSSDSYKDSEHGKDSWGGGHDKPRGGMHTGGGGLASPSVTAGGLGVLAAAGLGLYAVRRKKSAQSLV